MILDAWRSSASGVGPYIGWMRNLVIQQQVARFLACAATVAKLYYLFCETRLHLWKRFSSTMINREKTFERTFGNITVHLRSLLCKLLKITLWMKGVEGLQSFEFKENCTIVVAPFFLLQTDLQHMHNSTSMTLRLLLNTAANRTQDSTQTHCVCCKTCSWITISMRLSTAMLMRFLSATTPMMMFPFVYELHLAMIVVDTTCQLPMKWLWSYQEWRGTICNLVNVISYSKTVQAGCKLWTTCILLMSHCTTSFFFHTAKMDGTLHWAFALLTVGRDEQVAEGRYTRPHGNKGRQMP